VKSRTEKMDIKRRQTVTSVFGIKAAQLNKETEEVCVKDT